MNSSHRKFKESIEVKIKSQLKENKRQNWIKKRKQEGKDYSEETYEEIQNYLKQEKEHFEEVYEETVKTMDSLYRDIDEQEIMDRAKMVQKQWVNQNETYINMKETIEEFRRISDASPDEEIKHYNPYSTRREEMTEGLEQ